MMVRAFTCARGAIVTSASLTMIPLPKVFQSSWLHAIMLLLCTILTSTQANDIVPPPPADGYVLYDNAVIHPVSRAPIPNGKMLVHGEIIVGIADRDTPLEHEDEADLIDCQGRHLYPGLISANGTLGLVEISAVRATVDLREPGSINPSVRSEIAVNPDSELLPVTRSNGVLTSLTVPQTANGLISGRSALITLDGWTWEDMLVKSSVGMHLFWPQMRESPSASESSLKSQRTALNRKMKQLDDFFSEARAYQAAAAAKGDEFRSDVRLAAMLPVLSKTLPVFIHAADVLQMQSALQFAQEQDLKIVLVAGRDVWRLASVIRSRKIPVILTSVQELPRRRWEAYDIAMRTPQKLQEAGILYCIANGSGSSGASNARNLPYIAAAAVQHGLDPDEALKAITLYPAQILGVGDQLGSLEPGKLATFIITNGNPLEITTNVEQAFIRGRKIDLSNKQTRLFEKYSKKYERQAPKIEEGR